MARRYCTTSLIDLVVHSKPTDEREKTGEGLELRTLFHNVVQFKPCKFDQLGSGFSSLNGIYACMEMYPLLL